MPVHFFLPKSKATHCPYVIKYIDLVRGVCNLALKLEGQVEGTCRQIWRSAQPNS